MGRLGPLSRKDLDGLRPGIHVRRAIRGLKPYIDAGLVITFRIEGLRRRPRLWALNPGHKGAGQFLGLLRALWWKYYSRKLRTRHIQTFRVPPARRIKADQAPMLLQTRGFRNHGDVLHLLAQFSAPVSQDALCTLLGAVRSTFYRHVAVLVVQGLVAETYEDGMRMFMLDRSHPVVGPLITWLHYVNRRSDLPLVKLSAMYREKRNRVRSTEWAWQQRRAAGAKAQGAARRCVSLQTRLDRGLSMPRLPTGG